MRLYDLSGAAPKERAVLKDHHKPAPAMDFSADGKMLAVAMDENAVLWDLREEKPRQHFIKAGRTFVAFAPDGSHVQAVEVHEKDGDFTRRRFFNTRVNGPLPKDAF